MPGTGKKAFREFVLLYHEVGNEDYRILDTRRQQPAARRSAHVVLPARVARDQLPLRAVLQPAGEGRAESRSPTTPTPSATRRRRCAPTSASRRRSARCTAAGEMFHIYHLHGGGIRWRSNPKADSTYDYADTGVNKDPRARVEVRAPRLAVDRPGRVLQARDRGRRRRRQPDGRRLPRPLPHRRALQLGHVALLARLQHARSPTSRRCATTSSGSQPPAPGGQLGRPDRPDDEGRHHADQGRPRRLDQALPPAAGRAQDRPGRLGLELPDRQLGSGEGPSTSASPRTRGPGRTSTTERTRAACQGTRTSATGRSSSSTRRTDARRSRSCVRTWATARRSRRTAIPARRSSARPRTRRNRRPTGSPIPTPGIPTACARRTRRNGSST